MKTVVLWATFGDDIKSLIRESDPADRRGGLACDALRSTMTSLLSVEVSDRAVCSIAPRRRLIQCHHLNATLHSSLNCSQVIKQHMMSVHFKSAPSFTAFEKHPFPSGLTVDQTEPSRRIFRTWRAIELIDGNNDDALVAPSVPQ